MAIRSDRTRLKRVECDIYIYIYIYIYILFLIRQVLISCIGFIGVIVCTVSVRYVGKRRLTLASLLGCAVSMLGLALWTLFHAKSANPNTYWTPFVLFTTLSFSFSFGIAPIPWVILSEIFPYRYVRCSAAQQFVASHFRRVKLTRALHNPTRVTQYPLPNTQYPIPVHTLLKSLRETIFAPIRLKINLKKNKKKLVTTFCT